MDLGKLAQVLGGAATAGGAVAAGTAGVLDQNKEEEWVGRLRDFLHPPAEPPMGSIASQEVARRFAPQGGEISQGDAFWMGGGRPLPQRSEADAYRMGGLAAMDQYKPNTFRELDRQDIEDRYGGADLHGIKLPPVSRDEPKAWFDAVVPQSPLDVGLMAAGPAGRIAGKGAAALTGAAGVMGELVDPAEAGVAGKLLRGKPGGPWEGGIRAYHSSPHDFDRFDWSKLRTGEGANTYGAGFYAAENPKVSGQGGEYWKNFFNKFSGPEREAAGRLQEVQFDRAAALDRVQRELERHQFYMDNPSKRFPAPAEARNFFTPEYATELKAQRELLASGQPIGPRTYEVNIAARPELLLDWDKPLKQQPQIVEKLPALVEGAGREAYDRALAATSKSRADELWGMAKDPLQATGEFAYERLAPHDFNRASDMLREAGIPGIRYLDQGSRGARSYSQGMIDNYGTPEAALEKARRFAATAEGDAASHYARIIKELETPQSYNYVVTDPSKLDILGKYGVVGTAGGGMAALAAQDQYQR